MDDFPVIPPDFSSTKFVQPGKRNQRPRPVHKISKPTFSQSTNIQIQPTVKHSRPSNLPQGMFINFLHPLNKQTGFPLTGRLKYFTSTWEKNYSGPLGLTSGTGISNRVYEASCSASSSQDAITDSNFGNSVGSGGARVIEQGGSSPGKTTSCDRGLHKFAVCSAKKGWRESPCRESKAIKSIHNIRTFQNGRYSYVKRPSKTGGLASKNRPQGCLFNSTHLDKSSEIPSFSVERQHARVSLSPLRFSFCPESVHEADETSCSSIETAGHSANNYLDNILIMAESLDLVLHQAASALNLL